MKPFRFDLSPYDEHSVPVGNQAPNLTKLDDQTNPIGSFVSLQVSANDPDGESFTWTVTAAPPSNGCGTILRERWDGIFGGNISDLTSDPAYPNSPDVQDYLVDFEIPEDVDDLYGSRLRGYIHAPVTGQYRFWLASDNGGELWLSTDEEANNATNRQTEKLAHPEDCPQGLGLWCPPRGGYAHSMPPWVLGFLSPWGTASCSVWPLIYREQVRGTLELKCRAPFLYAKSLKIGQK